MWNLEHQGVHLPDVLRDDDAASVACRDLHLVCTLREQAVFKRNTAIIVDESMREVLSICPVS